MFNRAITAQYMEAKLAVTYLRFSNLVDRGIVNNRMTLSRWIKTNGFPPPYRLGPNTVAWCEDEIFNWLAERQIAQEKTTA